MRSDYQYIDIWYIQYDSEVIDIAYVGLQLEISAKYENLPQSSQKVVCYNISGKFIYNIIMSVIRH